MVATKYYKINMLFSVLFEWRGYQVGYADVVGLSLANMLDLNPSRL